MSRAFVNEDSAAAQSSQPVERRVSDQPNFVTASGLAKLHQRISLLQSEHSTQLALGDRADKQRQADIERDLRYFTLRAQSARTVPPARSSENVAIGNWVTFADDAGEKTTVRLVGEDEADAAMSLINWGSPLGRALMNAQPGDEVVWQRPAGRLLIEIIEILPE